MSRDLLRRRYAVGNEELHLHHEFLEAVLVQPMAPFLLSRQSGGGRAGVELAAAEAFGSVAWERRQDAWQRPEVSWRWMLVQRPTGSSGRYRQPDSPRPAWRSLILMAL